ncbi:MAG: hypothetical protein ACT443_01290 [Gemmatimonadota bacterium]
MQALKQMDLLHRLPRLCESVCRASGVTGNTPKGSICQLTSGSCARRSWRA